MCVVSKVMLHRWFSPHTLSEDQRRRCQDVRAFGKALGEAILEATRPSPDQTVALRRLRETVRTAIDAITCEEQISC